MTNTQTTAEQRAEYIAGLRMLADLLETQPHLRLPFDGTATDMVVFLSRGEDQRARLAEWARALPGKKSKQSVGVEGELYKISVKFGGLRFAVIADRDEVCERVVVATREVTEEVPDPEALAAVPTTPVTRTVEDVEWVCHSILDERSAELSEVTS